MVEPVSRMHAEGESNRSILRRKWSSTATASRSGKLIERDSGVFLHQSLSTPCSMAAERAEGTWIRDADGRWIMDFHGNSVHHVGHGHPSVISAIKDQLDKLSFSPRRFTNEPAILLAERLSGLAPTGLGKCLFATGGPDAIEIALRIARAATGRFKTLSFWNSFHGAGFGASSVGGEATFRSHVAGPLLPGTEHVAPYCCYRCPYGHAGPESCGTACAEMVRYVLEREGDVAAVVAEPMRAVPHVPPEGFWKSVRKACDDCGTLLIFDEIPTGLGKTGRFFALEHEDVVPDMVVLGKALGGGILPIAATIARNDLDVCSDFAIGHYTHEKNPVTARAALATLDVIEDERLVDRAATLGSYFIDRLRSLAESSGIVGDVRGRGLLAGLDIVTDKVTRSPGNEIAERILYDCLDQGLSFKISEGCVLTLSPPLTTSKNELDAAADILEAAIAKAERSGVDC